LSKRDSSYEDARNKQRYSDIENERSENITNYAKIVQHKADGNYCGICNKATTKFKAYICKLKKKFVNQYAICEHFSKDDNDVRK